MSTKKELNRMTKKELLEYLDTLEETLMMKDSEFQYLELRLETQQDLRESLMKQISEDTKHETRAVGILKGLMVTIQRGMSEMISGKTPALSYMEVVMEVNLAISILQNESAFEYSDRVVGDILAGNKAAEKEVSDV